MSKGTIFVQYAAIDTVCCNCAAALQQCAATWYFLYFTPISSISVIKRVSPLKKLVVFLQIFWYVLQLQPLCHKYEAVCCKCFGVSSSNPFFYDPHLKSSIIYKFHTVLAKKTGIMQYAAIYHLFCKCAAVMQHYAALGIFLVQKKFSINRVTKILSPTKY